MLQISELISRMENQPGNPGEAMDMAGAGDASLTLMDTSRLDENEDHPFLRAVTFDLVSLIECNHKAQTNNIFKIQL